jgi:uroporphyrinogen-III synthase
VTRHADRARPLVELLHAEGARVRLAPLLEATLPADTAPLAGLLARAAEPSTAPGTWLAVTSVNTVRALQALAGGPAAPGERLAAARRAGLRVAAVGDATAAALRAAGLAPDLVPRTAHSAEGLLAEWPEEQPPGTVLLPLSARARPVLADGLAARGYRVRAATAYTTVPWPAPAPLPSGREEAAGVEVLDRSALLAALAAGGADAVVLTAPSHLAELVGDDPAVLAGTALVAIGEPTRRAAAERGLRATAAQLPTPEGIRDALVRALAVRAPGAAPTEPTAPTTPTASIEETTP